MTITVNTPFAQEEGHKGTFVLEGETLGQVLEELIRRLDKRTKERIFGFRGTDPGGM